MANIGNHGKGDEMGTGTSATTIIAGAEDEFERNALQLAERRAQRRLIKQTTEILEIDEALLSCPSTEMLPTFRLFLVQLLDTKSATGSLECFQIMLNSLSAFYAKNYPEQEEKGVQEMVNSLLCKVLQKISTEVDFEFELGKDDSNKTRCCCELLCLLEMYLMRFPNTSIHRLNQKGSVFPGNLNTSALQRKTTTTNESSSKELKGMTQTQMATMNVVARLRRLYIMCTEPEWFRQFLDEVFCDEFLEDLPFYLACIYEQLAMEMPEELRIYRSQESREQDEQEELFDKAPFRLDLRPYRNKQADMLAQLLRDIEQPEEGEEDKMNADKENQQAKKGVKRKKSVSKEGSKKLQQQQNMDAKWLMAPKKQRQMARASVWRGSSGVRKIELGHNIKSASKKSPLKMGDLHTLARRKINLVPQTPEKKIAQQQLEKAKRRSNSDGKLLGTAAGDEDEVVQQTPIGKIRGDESHLTNKLAELLLREELRHEKMSWYMGFDHVELQNNFINDEGGSGPSTSQQSQVRKNCPIKTSTTATSSYAMLIKQRQQAKGNHQNERSKGILASGTENGANDSGRKRPAPPSVTADLLKLKLQQQQAAKKPRRRLFSASKSSNSSQISFPFSTSSISAGAAPKS